MRTILASTVLMALSAGCTGDKGDTSDTSATDTQTTDTQTGDVATFTRVRDEVLTPSCSLGGCHNPPSTSTLALSPGGEYAALVGVASPVAGTLFVEPNNPDGSYLVQKLEDAPEIVDSPMPPPFGGLEPAQIQLVRDWIAAGALDN